MNGRNGRRRSPRHSSCSLAEDDRKTAPRNSLAGGDAATTRPSDTVGNARHIGGSDCPGTSLAHRAYLGCDSNAGTIAEREGCSVRKVNMTISLAFLAPDLVKAAIAGRLPHGMGVARLGPNRGRVRRVSIWACSLSPPSEKRNLPRKSGPRYPSPHLSATKEKRDAEICPQRQGPEPRTFCSALRHRDRDAPRTCPVFAGIGRQNHKAAQKQGLAGWGARIRTWEWRIKIQLVCKECQSAFRKIDNSSQSDQKVTRRLGMSTPRPRQLGCT